MLLVYITVKENQFFNKHKIIELPFKNDNKIEEFEQFINGADYIIEKSDKLELPEYIDIFHLNILLNSLIQDCHFSVDDDKNWAVLNLVLKDRVWDLDDVKDLFRYEKIMVHEETSFGSLARTHLEEKSSWFKEAIESESYFERYFDFEAYAHDVLGTSGNYIMDDKNRFIIEIIE